MPPKAKTTTKTKKKKTAVVRKTKPEAQKHARFRSRGPHKCVVSAEGRSLKGVHSVLAKTIAAKFNYDKAKENGTLREEKRERTEQCVPMPVCITKRRKLAYSKKEGTKLDGQMTRVAKLCFPLSDARKKKGELNTAEAAVPLMVLVDPQVRAQYFATGHTSPPSLLAPYTPPSAALKKRIQDLCGSLMNETLQVLHYLATHRWRIAGTQVVVAKGDVGTQVDLVLVRDSCADENGQMQHEYLVCELKNGCTANWTHGKSMGSPYVGKLFTTHREYQAQTMLNGRLFRHRYPGRRMLPPLLMRPDRTGLWLDIVPAWMKEKEEALAARCGC